MRRFLGVCVLLGVLAVCALAFTAVFVALAMAAHAILHVHIAWYYLGASFVGAACVVSFAIGIVERLRARSLPPLDGTLDALPPDPRTPREPVQDEVRWLKPRRHRDVDGDGPDEAA